MRPHIYMRSHIVVFRVVVCCRSSTIGFRWLFPKPLYRFWRNLVHMFWSMMGRNVKIFRSWSSLKLPLVAKKSGNRCNWFPSLNSTFTKRNTHAPEWWLAGMKWLSGWHVNPNSPCWPNLFVKNCQWFSSIFCETAKAILTKLGTHALDDDWPKW